MPKKQCFPRKNVGLIFSEKRELVVASTWSVFTGASCESGEGGGGGVESCAYL